MAPPARRAPRAGQWTLVVLATVTVAIAAAAGYAWLTRDQGLAVAPAAASAAPVLPPAAEPQAVMAELVQLAPEFTPGSAQMLVSTAPNMSGHGLAEIGWLTATRGFDDMDREDLRELGALLEEVYAPLPPEDHTFMAQYLNAVRDGSLSREEGARGRSLFTDGVNKLAPERRTRLQTLVEKAIRAGVAARQRAEGGTQEALMVPAPAPVPSTGASEGAPAAGASPRASGAPPAAPAEGSASPPAAAAAPAASPGPEERGEGYWRARMQAARARVARLRNQIADMDKAAARDAVTGADQKKRLDDLARLRAELAEAERAVGDLEEEARAAGALPGWLRE